MTVYPSSRHSDTTLLPQSLSVSRSFESKWFGRGNNQGPS